jgi:acyl-CoA thioester hydrolase
MGRTYKDVEDEGYLLVLARIEVKYKRPARYDDVLTLRTIVERTTGVRIEHRYELYCQGKILAEGSSTLACIDREGNPQALPTYLANRTASL